MTDWVQRYFQHNYLMILAAFGTSVVSGTIGVAGGILLLVFMAPFFPAAILIPLHGLVQLASNLTRVALNFREIDKRIIRHFVIGALVGAVIGSQVVIRLPEREYKIILGIFILIMTWLPEKRNAPQVPGKFIWLGGVASFISLFVGAIGPLISPFYIRENLGKERLVVTKAACQSTVHFLKVGVFFYLGFQLGEYFPLFLGMATAVFFGNWCGKLILGRIPEALFMRVFKLAISALALQMVIKTVLI